MQVGLALQVRGMHPAACGAHLAAVLVAVCEARRGEAARDDGVRFVLRRLRPGKTERGSMAVSR